MGRSSSSMVFVGSLDKELSKSTVGFSGIPIGFAFHPFDRNLVTHYLYKKIWDAFGGIDNEDLLFFTNLRKISPTTSLTHRQVGGVGGSEFDGLSRYSPTRIPNPRLGMVLG
ncbi:unnamed protein product [Dovyalis caffra]|uniref:NAC domain-containing protein n=1 Tax=Dovyalis caffra TaxID=77055 RepID=A0AAV1QTM9_9ROSI|nr:unnamed protein product [Dovyalis caffra]